MYLLVCFENNQFGTVRFLFCLIHLLSKRGSLRISHQQWPGTTVLLSEITSSGRVDSSPRKEQRSRWETVWRVFESKARESEIKARGIIQTAEWAFFLLSVLDRPQLWTLSSSMQQKTCKGKAQDFSQSTGQWVFISLGERSWEESKRAQVALVNSGYMLWVVFMTIISKEVQEIKPSHTSDLWVLSSLNCDHLSSASASLLSGQGAVVHLLQVLQLLK